MDNIKKCEGILEKYRVIADKYKVCRLNKNKHLKEIHLFKETDRSLYIEYMHHFLKIFIQRINLPKDFGILEVDGFEEPIFDGIKELLRENEEGIIDRIFSLFVECRDINNIDKYGERLLNIFKDVAKEELPLRYGYPFLWCDEISYIIEMENKLKSKGTYFGGDKTEKTLKILSRVFNFIPEQHGLGSVK